MQKKVHLPATVIKERLRYDSSGPMAALASYFYYDDSGRLRVMDWSSYYLRRGGDFEHGLIEGQSHDLHEEVDGVTGEIALWPAPEVGFDDEAGEGLHRVITATTLA
ncbi:MAG: hypothetical protein SFY80_03730 [Verrucomicrobiota bacterium]|nr:hypothetical protein [Verrucomicrobiota bacterium]